MDTYLVFILSGVYQRGSSGAGPRFCKLSCDSLVNTSNRTVCNLAHDDNQWLAEMCVGVTRGI